MNSARVCIHSISCITVSVSSQTKRDRAGRTCDNLLNENSHSSRQPLRSASSYTLIGSRESFFSPSLSCWQNSSDDGGVGPTVGGKSPERGPSFVDLERAREGA